MATTKRKPATKRKRKTPAAFAANAKRVADGLPPLKKKKRKKRKPA